MSSFSQARRLQITDTAVAMPFVTLPRAIRSCLLAAALLGSSPTFCSADSLDKVGFHLAQDSTGATVSEPVLESTSATATTSSPDQVSSKQQWIRTADSFLTTTLITYGLKSVIHEDRPDDSGDDSFPSLHASAAFSIAATQAHFHPKQAPYWYGAATLIGVQRVVDDKHHWHDVIAGGALGYFVAKWEVGQKKGLLLRPFINSDDNGTRTSQVRGLSITKVF